MSATAEKPEKESPELVELRKLLRQAQRGDRTVLPQLRQTLDAEPAIWRRVGDLAAHARAAWLDLLAGPDLGLRACAERQLDELQAELAGPDPSPLEKLLVQRVTACWLQVQHADAVYAQTLKADGRASVLREILRRQESAQRRHLAAVKQLALIRKLLRPASSSRRPAAHPAAEPAVRLVRPQETEARAAAGG
jgi:hypothetical protein